jgi:hypothetical protein
MTMSLYRARHAGGRTWENIFTASQARGFSHYTGRATLAGGLGRIFSQPLSPLARKTAQRDVGEILADQCEGWCRLAFCRKNAANLKRLAAEGHCTCHVASSWRSRDGERIPEALTARVSGAWASFIDQSSPNGRVSIDGQSGGGGDAMRTGRPRAGPVRDPPLRSPFLVLEPQTPADGVGKLYRSWLMTDVRCSPPPQGVVNTLI